MSDNSVRGRFVWHELMTTNTTSAAGFFTKLVGWKTMVPEHVPSYTMFVTNGRPMAGVMALTDDAKAMGAPPSWLSYIATPDVDATTKQAISLGGKVLKPPADIPTYGRFAVIQDPQGAIFIAFTPLPAGQPAGAEDAVPGVGDFSWHELATTDWRAALTFYQQLFGWEETSSMDMGPEMGTYQMFGRNGKTLGGMFKKPSQIPGPAFWLPYIKVTDAKKAAALTTQLGGKVMHGPSEVPGGDLIVQGMDIEGAVFAVHSAKPAEKAKPAAKKKPVAKAKAVAKKKPAARKKPVVKKKAAPARKASKARKAPAKRTKSKAKATKAKPRSARKKGRR